ncbi:MAG: hypothetical protein U0821_25270 [Chloroflexota bacterium]
MGRRWSDTPVRGGPIKASHISTLRTYVDADLASIGKSYAWGWDTSEAAVERVIKARHLTDLKAAIQILWNDKSRGPLPSWSGGEEPGGPSNPPGRNQSQTRIRASDVNDLRRWLNQYEDNHPLQVQGIDTMSYAIRQPGQPLIQDAWAEDIRLLKTQQPLAVRCNVVAMPFGANNTLDLADSDFARYEAAFNRFRAKGLRVFALFTRQFYDRAAESPGADLTPGMHSNLYMREFASRVATAATRMRDNAGVRDFIIWNEPNVGPNTSRDRLSELNYALLLRTCYQRLPSDVRMYWGGVQFGPGDDPAPDPDPLADSLPSRLPRGPDLNTVAYIRNVHQALIDRELVGAEIAPWPWAGINVHIHGPRHPTQVAAMFSHLDSIRLSEFGGTGELVIGEWGVQHGTYQAFPDALSKMYGFLFNGHPDLMFYYSHHHHLDPVHDTDPNADWGLRDPLYQSAPPRTDPPNDTQWLLPGGLAGPSHGPSSAPVYLWNRFDALMGT